MNTKNTSFLLGFLLLVAVFPLPYGYYVFLRLSIFVGSIFLAHAFYKRDQFNWMLVLAGLAILFNPIIPVHLSRGLWLPIDMVSAVTFFFIGNKLERKEKGDA